MIPLPAPGPLAAINPQSGDKPHAAPRRAGTIKQQPAQRKQARKGPKTWRFGIRYCCSTSSNPRNQARIPGQSTGAGTHNLVLRPSWAPQTTHPCRELRRRVPDGAPEEV